MLGELLRNLHTAMELELRPYLDSLPRGGVGDFAEKVGISSVYLSQLAARQNDREPSPELCVSIERESGRIVTRRKLRPKDWHLIWPELVTPDHPAPATPTTEQASA